MTLKPTFPQLMFQFLKKKINYHLQTSYAHDFGSTVGEEENFE